ncbi:MAG: hypothetical protein MUF49_05980 [Oculatellaceae cyanobacterium Prado106]|nr:hypothetical protein [Oculatellaceae cyanobacterium Prado106]
MNKKSSTSQSTLSVQTVVMAATVWAVFALLFFLLFSASSTDGGRPQWYSITTYILEGAAFFAAGMMCFRNWRSSQIVSGGQVWLAIGLGMFSYFIGNLFLAYWEIGLGNSPEVSPGDLFFILTYLFLGFGMLKAVLSKKLNLAPLQYLILAGIATGGITIAWLFAPSQANAAAPPAALIAQAAPATQVAPTQPAANRPPAVNPATGSAPASAPRTLPTASPAVAPTTAPFVAPGTAPLAAPVVTETPAAEAAEEESPNTPEWAIALEKTLTPLADIVSWLYIVGDVILVIMASTLLLAFWGGKFSQSWQFIAAAAFCYYIADLWFNYATRYIPNYETGSLPEVFWIFSACLFAIGAALEYDLSTRRRNSRRRA